MAAALRIGVVGLAKPLTQAALPALTQSRSIYGKVMRKSLNITAAKPFPYKTTNYGITQALMDRTTKRWDDNTKVRRQKCDPTSH
jgi:hypothetical protein